ncbi:dynamin family protein [Kibdelosporangium aridum]|nr:dynamin family protein [Kibdelosporangium aridum]
MVPHRQAWPLTEAVLDLALRAERSPDHVLAAAGHRAVERLQRPLCVAVVGRLSSGKSTLLNALLGSAVSPTGEGEVTKVVYLFRHGMWDSAVAHPRDGSSDVPLRLDNGRLPGSIPIPADRLRYIDVTLTAGLLERATLVDTPGLASTSVETSAATSRMLADTQDAAVEADALLFCLNTSLKDDEAQAVQAFRAGKGGRRLSGGTAVGVLTKADHQGKDRRTAWKTAGELARRMSSAHADLFSCVVPVVGLLAEAATTGGIRERHARALSALARAWNPDQSEIALLDKEMFLDADGPVPVEERQQLVDLLGMYGIGELLEALRSGVAGHAAALIEVARKASGFDAMTARLEVALGGRADALKAAAALEELIELAYAAGDHTVYDQAQTLLDRPEMFPVRIVEMGQVLAQGRVRLPAGLAQQAWIVVTTGPSQLDASMAAREVAAWREWAALSDSSGRFIAWTMVRAWRLAAAEKKP